jgi:hypothetical protein
MPTDKKREGLLSSWKEIALYLDCYERTCRRWEGTLGLPILRIEGASKSRIYAYKDELDQWRSEKLKNGNSSNGNPQITNPRLKWHKGYLIIFIIPILLLLPYLSNKLIYSRQPADFSIDRNDLIINNRNGKELWRFETGITNLCDERKYKQHYLNKKFNEKGCVLLPNIVIEDINRDGKKEVLFSFLTEDEFKEDELICFNHKGKTLWKYKSGREMKYGSSIYPSEYRITAVGVLDLHGNNDPIIIIISTQRYQFPCQVTVLTNKGEKVGEYWNSGYFNDYLYIDIDEDGEKEILLAGMNNEFKKGCIAVFDPISLYGSSPQIEDSYRCKDLNLGSEKYYILFPRTDVDLIENSPIETIMEIESHTNQKISARTQVSCISFFFDYNMRCDQVQLSHDFEKKHKNAFTQGKIKSELNNYPKNLKNEILYWDGTKWVSSPTMNLRWKDSAEKPDTNRNL